MLNPNLKISNNFAKRIIYIIFCCACLLLVTSQRNHLPAALADGGKVYYISPGGNDNNSGVSETESWATLGHALGYWDNNLGVVPGQVQPGDTLILMDGTYYQSIDPRGGGQPDHPITIRAKNDGQATIDGQGIRTTIALRDDYNANYFVIEGIVARNGPTTRGQHVVDIRTDNNILRRVSVYDANTDDNNFVINISGDHNLVEDCIAAGSGRKMIIIFKGQYNTIRRCLADWREWDGRDAPQSYPWGDGIELYQGDYNIVENSISYGHAAEYGISLLANGSVSAGSTCIGNKILGSMSINTGRNHDNSLVYWGPDPNNPALTQVQPTIRPQPSIRPPDSVRQLDNPGLRVGVSFYGGGRLEDNFLQDIFVWGSAGHGLSVFDPYFEGNPTVKNNVVNRATFINNGVDVGENLHVDDPAKVTVTNSFVEDNPAHQGEGARLEYRYINGELMDGTNGQPAQPLWPWPMEDRIQAELGYSLEAKIRPLVEDLTTGFFIEANPSTQIIEAGDTVTTTLSIQSTTSFTGTVTVTAVSPSTDLNLSLSGTTVSNLPQVLTLTLTDLHDPSFSEGVLYTVPVVATDGSITRTINVDLLLNGQQAFLPAILK